MLPRSRGEGCSSGPGGPVRLLESVLDPGPALPSGPPQTAEPRLAAPVGVASSDLPSVRFVCTWTDFRFFPVKFRPALLLMEGKEGQGFG